MSLEAREADSRSSSNALLVVYLARFIRAFCFGSLSVIFALFLMERGFGSLEIGSIVSATLIEDAVLTAFVSVLCARIGMRLLLLGASVVFVLSGLVFAFCSQSWIVSLAAIFGIISPTGYEGGPFGAVEQAIISEHAPVEKLAHEFSVYNLIAFAGSAIGSALTGFVFPLLKQSYSTDTAYSWIFISYACGGFLMFLLYCGLKGVHSKTERSADDAAKSNVAEGELPSARPSVLKSGNVWKLCVLQGLDAFGGGFIPATLISYWFFERFHAGPEFTGPVFGATYALSAASFLLAPMVCKRFGLLNTMVFTHLPCSMALCAIPFMPSAFAAGAVLVARSLFSSMDIPARQAYSMVLVPKEDRTAVAGLTSASRSFGQCVAPMISGWALANTLSGLSFQMAGGLKTFYDLAIFFCFRNVPLSTDKDA